MRVIEAVTENEVCRHCRAPWTGPTEALNGCCTEDAHDLLVRSPRPGFLPTPRDPNAGAIIHVMEWEKDDGINPLIYIAEHRIYFKVASGSTCPKTARSRSAMP